VHTTGSEIILDYLSNWPDRIPELAGYAYDEWRALFESKGQNYEDALSSYRERAKIDSLPLALVALHDGNVIGTASIKINDLDIRPEITPWLGGVFVVPQWRRRGIATHLIRRAIEEAHRLHLSELYLWTPSARSLYERLGWSELERLKYCGYEISVMKRKISANRQPPARVA
jgi:GNAT superfamily N-acetyltransferase